MFKMYVRARLREPSTWKGIISVACGIGVFSLTAAQIEAAAAAGAAVYMALSILFPDVFGVKES